MAFDSQRQTRRRFALPVGAVDIGTAAEALQVSPSAVRRRVYSGELRVVGRRSDVGVLLDAAQVEELASAIERGEVPADRRHLNGKQGRKPSTPMVERRPAVEPAVSTRDAPAEPVARAEAPSPTSSRPTPWRPT